VEEVTELEEGVGVEGVEGSRRGKISIFFRYLGHVRPPASRVT
jgi:hypothetical protein